MSSSIRVLIADDQQLVRTGLCMILDTDPDIDVVDEATNGREAVAMARELGPDVVLMDIRMPELDGIEATRRVVQQDGETSTRVPMLTTFDLDEYVYVGLRAGASGFLLKDAPANQLAAPTPPGLDELTPREFEVFRLVAQGKSNAEIAAELIIGETTLKTRVARMTMKLGVHDRVQAVVLAYELGVVTPSRRPADRDVASQPGSAPTWACSRSRSAV
ncbi:MAG: response regulator transcription factor [Solirubrobacterales bacterium]|nr:response regulator transcription factor [Solirubrobacterales bacterium]